MALIPILRLGHPSLRTPAQPVPRDRIAEAAFQTLIDDMVESMRDEHGVGLAAPQVGVAMQLFIYEAAGPPEIPLSVVINPLVTPQAREMSYDWEGCLSIPDLRGLVPRHPKVKVQGLDREGKPLNFIATGFEARIVQHEYDHLNGVVFLDRMRDFKTLAFFEEWETYLMGRSQPDPDDGAAG